MLRSGKIKPAPILTSAPASTSTAVPPEPEPAPLPHVAPHPNEIEKTEDTATEDTATPDECSEGVGKIQSSKGLFSTFAGNKMTEDTDREILSVDPDIPSNVSERAIDLLGNYHFGSSPSWVLLLGRFTAG